MIISITDIFLKYQDPDLQFSKWEFFFKNQRFTISRPGIHRVR